MRASALDLSTLCLSLGVLVLCLRPSIAQPRIILEAEDFQTGGGWEARPWEDGYFCASFASDFLSRQAFLGAPAQGETSAATAEFDVPQSGRYALFVRYACPFMHNVEFRVVIEQPAGASGAAQADESGSGGRATRYERTFGRLQGPKIWPFGGGIQPMPTYDWGGGDNLVWEGEQVEFRLREGPAKVTILAGPQPEPAAERQIDVLLLTALDEEVTRRLQSWSYLPLDGLLTQEGEVELRVANGAETGGGMVVELTTVEHGPYWVHGRDWRSPLVIGARGVVEGRPTAEDQIRPGQSSPPVPIGHRLDRLNESTLKAELKYEEGAAEGTDAVFEFTATGGAESAAVSREDSAAVGGAGAAVGGAGFPARRSSDSRAGEPAPRRGLRTIHYRDATTRLIRFAIPGNVHGEEQIRTAEEELERILAYVKSLPDERPTPKLLGIRGVFTGHFTGTDSSQRVRDLAAEIRRELVGEAAEAGIQVESLGDEIGLKLAEPSEETNQAFREYLQDLRVKPEDLVPPEVRGAQDLWSLVSLDYGCRETNPALWYHSQVFGYENGSLLELERRTAQITADSGGNTRTGANYSPHPCYWPKEFQWVRPFKLGALTMPWSEDYVWGIPELSPQVTGYLMDVFRCGAKYHDLPIVFYVMPHEPGNTPRSFRLSYYSALAHGAKLIHHFCVTPIVTAYTENYVSARFLPMYGEIAAVARDVASFEDILVEGRVRPAKVALLISGSTDLWDPSPNYNHERKCLYYALRHSGVPVDFVTEDDIAGGLLDPYRVLYISASHMTRAAAKALGAWVEAGGSVLSTAGGGLLDEVNRPHQAMLDLFGLEGADLREHDALPDTVHTLPRLRPASGLRLSLPGATPTTLPALATVQRLRPAESGQTVGQFHDGSPAAVLCRRGRGQALLIGGFPGAAYVSPAIPIRPWDRGTTDEAMCHFLPTEFDGQARDAILWPLQQAGIVPDVRVSEPVVEWNVVDAPGGSAIFLLNWTGRPIEALQVTVRGELGDRSVSSTQQGALQPERTADGWQVTLPLGITDCIMVRAEG